ncbi:uncharacterized protein LOC135204705 [Macrobrachium nipponense]|uniref:uncharacterized protein LOC135204705 n=1 Tax=Macrobrachium nipponense TaxID=159736 RepID=UPI0030C7BE42
MASNPLECDICCNTYNDDHCPKILPCSHEFCYRCIEGLIFTQKKECPLCRTEFSNSSAEELMINRGLLDAAKQLSSMLAVSNTKETRPKQPFLKTTQVFRENFTKRGIAVCQGAEAEVQGLIDSYRDMKKVVQEVKLSSEKTLTSIDRSIKLLLNRLEKLQKNKTKLNESDAQLEAATDFISAAPLMQEAEELLQAMEETLAKFQEDKKEECCTKKEIFKMKENLERFFKDTERITEERKQEEERDSVVKIMVTDPQILHGRLRGDTQREIFAVMTHEGKLRLAPIKIEYCVNHLEDGVLPPRCFVIELGSLISGGSPSPPLSSPPPRGFLDLAYKSTPLGRVIIRITINGLKGRNLLYMCAGGMGGPSYVHSRGLKVTHFGWGGEGVSMGHYVSHGRGGERGGVGASTRAVLSSREEDWGRERETYEQTPYKAGDVRGDISSEGASRFWIVTRGDPNWRRSNCFGMVEEGLDVLIDVISKYPDITQVKVANCGLIL